MLLAPAPDTPFDAQSLARAELVELAGDVSKAKAHRNLDLLTRAHIDALAAVAQDALTARSVVPVTRAVANPD
jgi:hypothetical protein